MKRKLLVALLLMLLFLSTEVFARSSHVRLQPDEGQQQEWNRFFSTFAETMLPEFDAWTKPLGQDDLIRFGLLANWAARGEKLPREGEFRVIPASWVEQMTEKYFDRRVTEHASALPGSEYDYVFRDGRYYRKDFAPTFFYLNKRTGIVRFAQIVSLDMDSENNYFVQGWNYKVEGPTLLTGKDYWIPQHQWSAEKRLEAFQVSRFAAVVQEVGEGKKRRKVLQNYRLDPVCRSEAQCLLQGGR